ncbi:MAG: LPS export ABC transporter periplasmic protein LptC [Pikeienuella sp.]
MSGDASPRPRRRKGAAQWVRYGLAGAVLCVLGAIFWLTNTGFEDDGLSVSGVDLSNLSEGLKLSNPRFTGETAKGEPFTLSAAWALPDGARPDEVELNEVAGEVHLADGRMVEMQAAHGVFFPKQDVVTVAGDVRLSRSDGYEITASAARVDAAASQVTAEGPVRAIGPQGEITAGSLRAERNGASGPGDYIWFENRVHLRIMQPKLASKQ